MSAEDNLLITLEESSECLWKVKSCSVVSDSLQPHGLQPARFLCPQSSPGKNNWSVWPIPSPGDLPDPGIKPGFPTLQVDSLPAELPGKYLGSQNRFLVLLVLINDCSESPALVRNWYNTSKGQRQLYLRCYIQSLAQNLHLVKCKLMRVGPNFIHVCTPRGQIVPGLFRYLIIIVIIILELYYIKMI